MGNHFNFDGFEVQKEGIDGLIHAFPTQSVPAATACIGRVDTTGARMYATKLLANAAYVWSGLDGPGPAGSGGDSERDKERGKGHEQGRYQNSHSAASQTGSLEDREGHVRESIRSSGLPLFISPPADTRATRPEREGGRRDNNSGFDSVFRLPDQDRKALYCQGNTSSSRAGPALIAPIKQQQQQSIQNQTTGESDDDDDASVQWMLAADLLWTLGRVRCSHNVFSFRGNLEGVLLVSTSSRSGPFFTSSKEGGLSVLLYVSRRLGKQRKQALQHYSRVVPTPLNSHQHL